MEQIKNNRFFRAIGKWDSSVKRLIVVMLVVFLFASVIRPGSFLKLGNFQSIGQQLSEYGLMALGVGLCMISGGIDLSVVYIANLCGVSAGLFMQHFAMNATGWMFGVYIALAVLLAAVIGLICGLINGLLVAKLKIPAMLATLGTYQLYMGVAIVLSKGSTVSGIPKQFTVVGTQMLFGLIPYSFLIFLVAVVIIGFLMKRTKLGTRIYLVGTNEKSSKFSGIHVSGTLIKTYMLSGLMAAIAGMISLSRLNSAKADFGSSYTMLCILIVVLGGVNPNGGFGNITGIAIGVVVLQTLSSLLNMFPSISNYYRDFIWGAALILILILNFVVNRRAYQKLLKAGGKKKPDKVNESREV